MPRCAPVGKVTCGSENPQAKGHRFWPLDVGLEASGWKEIKQHVGSPCSVFGTISVI